MSLKAWAESPCLTVPVIHSGQHSPVSDNQRVQLTSASEALEASPWQGGRPGGPPRLQLEPGVICCGESLYTSCPPP